MSDSDQSEVWIRHGTRVAPQAVWLARDRMLESAAQLHGIAHGLAMLRSSFLDGDRAEATAARLGSLAQQLGGLAESLSRAMERYGEKEAAATRSAEEISGRLLWCAGFAFGPLSGGLLSGTLLAANSNGGQAGSRFSGETAWLVDGADDLLAGSAHLPPVRAKAAESTKALRHAQAAARSLGLSAPELRFVALHSSPSVSVGAPASVAELAARIPQAGREQTRIERYEVDGEPVWLVYIAGTRQNDGEAGSEPFDFEGDLQSVAGETSQAEQAVRGELARSGYHPGDAMILVGHSQGALIANRIAADPNFTVRQQVLLGAPLGATAPADVPTLNLQVAGDPVVGLGGFSESAPQMTTIVAPPPPGARGIERHVLESYVPVAARVDASSLGPVREHANVLRTVLPASATGRANNWRAERTAVPEDGGESRRPRHSAPKP